jgi:pimeloyl-ACP methyl ester carboxylesterase
MAQRIAAMPVFLEAVRTADIDHDALRSFQRPVLYTLGGRSHAWYRAMGDRLARVFPDFTLKVFEERHHFDPPHRAEPERFAATLLAHWERAKTLGVS